MGSENQPSFSVPNGLITLYKSILAPDKLWAAKDLWNTAFRQVPWQPGVYGWYFEEIPSGVPTSGCIQVEGKTLLYIGKAAGEKGINHRLKKHFQPDASWSTLRRSLGCLLGEELGIQLKIGTNGRVTFGAGESRLTDWLLLNGWVSWMITPDPKNTEDILIDLIKPPLNIDKNSNPFSSQLSRLRSEAKR